MLSANHDVLGVSVQCSGCGQSFVAREYFLPTDNQQLSSTQSRSAKQRRAVDSSLPKKQLIESYHGDSRAHPPAQFTPWAFFYCLLIALPALFVAKFVTVGFFDPVVTGAYKSANRMPDETYLFLTQFVSCSLAGFVFVFVGALCTKRHRSVTVWVYALLASVAALALGDMNGPMGMIGQFAGAFMAAFIFWKM